MCLFIWMLSNYLIFQDLMRININEVSNCEIPRPPIEVSEEEKKPISSPILMYVVKMII